MTSPISQAARRLALAAAACLVPGCLETSPSAEGRIACFLSSHEDILRTRRVVFIELAAVDDCPPQVAWDTTRALGSAVQARRLFHVETVRRTDAMCRDLPIEGIEALTLPELAAMRQGLRCDAVLFGRVSHFQPFPRMQLGLYLKLIDLKDGKLVWGVDDVWDTTDQSTERRIRKYFYREVRDGYDPLGHELVLKSPRAFERFIAYEVAETLQRPHPSGRNQPASPKRLK